LTKTAYVKRGAVIKVNEEGAEAAVATAIIRESLSSYLKGVVTNMSFTYLIKDRASGIILFIGHIVDPSEA